MWHDEERVITGEAILIWDGITNPKTDPKDGKVKHDVKIALPSGAPEVSELEQLATKCLRESKWKGQLPGGGNWPVQDLDTTKEGLRHLQGYKAVNAKTTLGAPPIVDVNGKALEPMEYSQMLYAGAKVKAMVHAYDFDNVSKGIAFGLDGLQIVDAQAPALQVGNGGGMSKTQVAAAFGGAATPPSQPTQPAPAPAGPPAPPAAPAPDFPNGPPAGPQMTDKAQGVPYESFIAQGWTDELLRAHGYMA